MFKKLVLSSALAFACFGTTASAANNITTNFYGAFFDYGKGSLEHKKVVGSTLVKTLKNSDNVMVDFKYVKLDSSIINPHKMTLAAEYTAKNIDSYFNYQFGGSYTNAYFPDDWGGLQHVYSLWAGAVEKKPIVLKKLGVKTGIKVYYTKYDFQDDQKLWQIDINNYKKVPVPKGKLFVRNTLSWQSFKHNDNQGNDKYVSDVLSAKYILGKNIYMGHIKIGNSALKVEQDAKYMIDTTDMLHKFGVGAGVAHKIKKNNMIFAKVRYNKVTTICGGEKTDTYEMKYVVGYKVKF